MYGTIKLPLFLTDMLNLSVVIHLKVERCRLYSASVKRAELRRKRQWMEPFLRRSVCVFNSEGPVCLRCGQCYIRLLPWSKNRQTFSVLRIFLCAGVRQWNHCLFISFQMDSIDGGTRKKNFTPRQKSLDLLFGNLVIEICAWRRSTCWQTLPVPHCATFFRHTLAMTAVLELHFGVNSVERVAVWKHVRMNMAVFWDVAPCSLVEIGRRFTGTFCLHHQREE
jgi:hypothetical protein